MPHLEPCLLIRIANLGSRPGPRHLAKKAGPSRFEAAEDLLDRLNTRPSSYGCAGSRGGSSGYC